MVKFLRSVDVIKRVYNVYYDAFEWVDYPVAINEEFDLDEVYFEGLVEGTDFVLIGV